MNHPPAAERVVCIDVDTTIAPWGPLFDLDPPFPGVQSAIQGLHSAGFKVVILTSRLSPTWWRDDYRNFTFEDSYTFAQRNKLYLEGYLGFWGIPYDRITAEKVPAEVYFDDRAIKVAPGWLSYEIDNWLEEES